MTTWFLLLQDKDRRGVCGKYSTAYGDV